MWRTPGRGVDKWLEAQFPSEAEATIAWRIVIDVERLTHLSHVTWHEINRSRPAHARNINNNKEMAQHAIWCVHLSHSSMSN